MGEYRCGALLKQINDFMEKNANRALKEQDITISQSGVLVLLDKKAEKMSTFKELEKSFGVSQPTMVGIINRLEHKELVDILADSDDKRIRRAQLTQKGADKCREGYKHMKAAEDLLLSSLTTEEKKEFLRLLVKIKDSMR